MRGGRFNSAQTHVPWKAGANETPRPSPGTVYHFLLPDDGMASRAPLTITYGMLSLRIEMALSPVSLAPHHDNQPT